MRAKIQRLSTVFIGHLLYNAIFGVYAVLPYIYSHHLPIHPILYRKFQTLYLSQQPNRSHGSLSYVQAGHCVSKQIGRHDAACQGCPRCVSRSPEACCFRVVARAVCFSQPAVLSALLVIRLFGIVIPPPYFPKEHQKEHCGREMVAALLHYVLWCASEYSVVGRISHRSSMITLEQTFFNDASEYLFPR